MDPRTQETCRWACFRFRLLRPKLSTPRRGASHTAFWAANGPKNINQKISASSCVKTDRMYHAHGFNDKPLFRCLPAQADRCPAGVVYEARRGGT